MADETQVQANAKQIQLISRLLAQADGTDSDAERDTAMSMAQTLASKYEIDLEVARSFRSEEERRRENRVVVIDVEIGEPKNRGAGTYSDLMIAIADANGVRWIRGDNNAWVRLYGMSFDIEVIQKLYLTLLVQMIREANAFIEEGSWREERGVSALGARKAFCHNFSARIKQRLNEARMRAEWEANREHGDKVAIVLADKRREINQAYYGANRNRRWYSPDRGSGRAGAAAGRRAGDRANLHDSRGVGQRGRITG